jgi:Glutamate synthase central domain
MHIIGQAWSTHHVAMLVGYGASAVVPYAAYAAVINWHSQKRNQLAMERGDLPKLTAAKAIANYRKVRYVNTIWWGFSSDLHMKFPCFKSFTTDLRK